MPASRSRSHSRRNCKACNDLAKLSLKANPMKNEKQEQEKLKYYTKQYQDHALAGNVTLAEQSIRKIKANHPILSRLQYATVQYLVKSSRILFKAGSNQTIYNQGSRVEQSVYILLYGRCSMRLTEQDAKKAHGIGHKMGLGYVFNEESLFANEEGATREHKESLVTCEETALLQIDSQVFDEMTDLNNSNRRGASPHLMGD